MCHLDEFQNTFLTSSRSHCILRRPTLNTEKQTNKQSLVVLLVSMRNILCFRTLNLTYGFDMTKFSQCQFETFSQIHVFQKGTPCQSQICFTGTCFRAAPNTCILLISTRNTDFCLPKTIQH